MKKIKKADLKSMIIPEDKLRQLKQVFPEVFTEGFKVDLDKLRRVLGENVDAGKERFGMNWPGKADCFKIIQSPSVATLIPAKDESVNFDTTDNLFIEGDNLEVLKLLQKSYYGKVKMIYIDPPYNTGSDFIYPDDYAENLETYLKYTGQIDDEGRRFSTNTEDPAKWKNGVDLLDYYCETAGIAVFFIIRAMKGFLNPREKPHAVIVHMLFKFIPFLSRLTRKYLYIDKDKDVDTQSRRRFLRMLFSRGIGAFRTRALLLLERSQSVHLSL